MNIIADNYFKTPNIKSLKLINIADAYLQIWTAKFEHLGWTACHFFSTGQEYNIKKLFN